MRTVFSFPGEPSFDRLIDYDPTPVDFRDRLIESGMSVEYAERLREYQIEFIWQLQHDLLRGQLRAFNFEVGLGCFIIKAAVAMLWKQRTGAYTVMAASNPLVEFYKAKLAQIYPSANLSFHTKDKVGIDILVCVGNKQTLAELSENGKEIINSSMIILN